MSNASVIPPQFVLVPPDPSGPCLVPLLGVGKRGSDGMVASGPLRCHPAPGRRRMVGEFSSFTLGSDLLGSGCNVHISLIFSVAVECLSIYIRPGFKATFYQSLADGISICEDIHKCSP